MKTIINRKVVVARKGVKGFFKTNVLDKFTTVVDCSIRKVTEVKDLLYELLVNKMPVVFKNEKKFTRSYAVEKIKGVVFKYALSIRDEAEEFSAILVANKNERYHLRVTSGRVSLKKIKEKITAGHWKETKIITMVPNARKKYKPDRQQAILVRAN